MMTLETKIKLAEALEPFIGKPVKHRNSGTIAILHSIPKPATHGKMTVKVKYRRPNGLIQYREWRVESLTDASN